MPEDKQGWQTVSRKLIYDNPWITLHENQVINPAGGDGIYGCIHFKHLAIAIIALDKQQNTWLVGQSRYALGDYSWEIPMGGGPIDQSPLISAKRELKEETGLSAEHWTEIMRLHTSNSVTDELGIVFLAEDLTEGETAFEDTEDISVRRLPFTEAIRMTLEGEITDAISVAALLKLHTLLKNKRSADPVCPTR